MSFPAADTLIIFALESETVNHWQDRDVLHTGIGKVNAAYRLGKALEQWRGQHGKLPGLVLNLGSAGSKEFKAGTIVNCTTFIQRDFDVTPLGFELHETPFEDTPIVLKTGLRLDAYVEGICGTGDNFVTDIDVHPWNVVDMEAYAFAKFCWLEQVPFACLKFITDGADGLAASSWPDALEAASRELSVACGKLLGPM